MVQMIRMKTRIVRRDTVMFVFSCVITVESDECF